MEVAIKLVLSKAEIIRPHIIEGVSVEFIGSFEFRAGQVAWGLICAKLSFPVIRKSTVHKGSGSRWFLVSLAGICFRGWIDFRWSNLILAEGAEAGTGWFGFQFYGFGTTAIILWVHTQNAFFPISPVRQKTNHLSRFSQRSLRALREPAVPIPGKDTASRTNASQPDNETTFTVFSPRLCEIHW